MIKKFKIFQNSLTEAKEWWGASDYMKSDFRSFDDMSHWSQSDINMVVNAILNHFKVKPQTAEKFVRSYFNIEPIENFKNALHDGDDDAAIDELDNLDETSVDDEGNSLLMIAAKENGLKTVQYIISYGAPEDMSYQNLKGEDFMDVAGPSVKSWLLSIPDQNIKRYLNTKKFDL